MSDINVVQVILMSGFPFFCHPPCSILGHEGSGLVIASAREGLQEGQRVTWGVCASCNKCLHCSIGLENKCKTLQKVSYDGEY